MENNSSPVLNPESVYYSTLISCQIPSYFRIAKRSPVIRRNLKNKYEKSNQPKRVVSGRYFLYI